jgi:ubiquinone/menaquinone biosynthesis C-methylase UbiE
MELAQIKDHWQDWAKKYGTSFRATTKNSTAKMIEVDALRRTIKKIAAEKGGKLKILEVGCGNGINCLELLNDFPEAEFTGVDYIPEMIESANELKEQLGAAGKKMTFDVGNILDLKFEPASFDIVFTVRCVINLNTDALQHEAIGNLAKLLKAGGHLLMLENSRKTYDLQNKARVDVGLPARTPDKFNLFFNEDALMPFLKKIGLECQPPEDFISLHDLVLYVLLPMTNGGKVDYNDPLVDAATKLTMAISANAPGSLGHYGQNRMFHCKKAA